MRVSDKVAFIVGGLGGIGLAVGKELLRNGAKGVVLVDVNIINQKSIIEGIEKEFGPDKAIAIKTDITQKNDIVSAFDSTIKTFKNLDIVINCAAIVSDDWEKELDVNYKAAYNILQLAMKNYLPKFKSGEEGLLINVGSVAGLDPLPLTINYAATKAALIHLSRSYAYPYFYEKYKVKVFVICPGLTDTPIIHTETKDLAFAREIMKSLPFQTPEQVAVLAVAAIGTFQNGDVYVVEDKKIYKKIFEERTLSINGVEKFCGAPGQT